MSEKVMDLEASIGIDFGSFESALERAAKAVERFAEKFEEINTGIKGVESQTQKSMDKIGDYIGGALQDFDKLSKAMSMPADPIISTGTLSYSNITDDRASNHESLMYEQFEKSIEQMEEYADEMVRLSELETKFNDEKISNIDMLQDKYQQKFQTISDGFGKVSGLAKDFLKIMAAPIAGGVLSAKTWINFNEEMVGVQKTADLTKREMESLSDTFREFALDEPIKVGDLAGIAQVGGRMDLDVGEIEEYTKVVSMMGVAFDDITPQRAAEQISQFTKITGSDVQYIEHLGSAITYLGNNFETTEGKVLSTALRLASTGQMIGMSEADILGLSGAMSGLGINSEMGGSAVSRTLQRMDSAVRSGSDELKMFARISGMTVNEFTRAWSEEPEKVLMHLTNGLAQLNEDGKDVYGIMAEMGISNHREVDVLLKMSSAQGEVKKAIEGANEAYREGTALKEEYEVMKDSDAGRYVILQNQLAEVRMEIGRNLMPAMEGLITALETLNDFIAKIPDEWLQALGKIGTAFVVVATIMAPIAGILGKIFGWISKIVQSKVVTGLLAGEGLAALGNFGVILGKIGTALGSFIGLLGKAWVWIKGILTSTAFTGFIVSAGKAIAIIAAIAAALWGIWEVGKFVIDLFKDFEISLGDSIGEVIKNILSIAGPFGTVIKLFEEGIPGILELFGFEFEWPDLLVPAKVAWQGVKDLFKDTIDGVIDLFTFDFEWPDLLGAAHKAWEGVKDFFSGSVDWVKDLFTFDFEWPSFGGGGGGGSRGGSGVSWNAEGGVFTQPTIFATPRAGLQGVGEAGQEAIIPLSNDVLSKIGGGIAVTMDNDNRRIEALLVEQIKATMGLGDRIEKMEVRMEGREVGSIVTPYVNSNLGKEQKFNNSRFR